MLGFVKGPAGIDGPMIKANAISGVMTNLVQPSLNKPNFYQSPSFDLMMDRFPFCRGSTSRRMKIPGASAAILRVGVVPSPIILTLPVLDVIK